MASPGLATTQTAAPCLIGPVSTQSGFQYWYLHCSTERIVAVRQGIGAFFAYGLLNGAVPRTFGILGLLINNLLKGRAQRFRERQEAILRRISPAQLRDKSNVEYSISKLRSFTFKNVMNGGNLILPSITLETADGKKQKYSVQRPDFDRACAQLRQMYPPLCR